MKYLEIRDSDIKLQYGDIVCFTFMGYRNDGLYILNEEKEPEELSATLDDYGTVPDTYPAFTKFPTGYFSNAIGYNNYIYVPPGLKCKSRLTVDYLTNFDECIDLYNQIIESDEVTVTEVIVFEYKNEDYLFLFFSCQEDGIDEVSRDEVYKKGSYAIKYTKCDRVIIFNFDFYNML